MSFLRLYERKLFIVYNKSASFVGYRDCGNNVFNYLVTSRDDVFKVLCDFMEGSFY